MIFLVLVFTNVRSISFLKCFSQVGYQKFNFFEQFFSIIIFVKTFKKSQTTQQEKLKGKKETQITQKKKSNNKQEELNNSKKIIE